MKTCFVLALLLAESAWAQVANPVTISIQDVAKKVSTQDYRVLESALQVYSAKQQIQVARGGLLPRLNVWRLAELAFDPRAAGGMIEDIAPFLVPANWFRVQEQKLLYEAQREGYRALWANEIMTAKGIFLHALLDHALVEHIERSEGDLRKIREIVEARELMGGVPQGTSRDIEVRLLALQEDRRALEVLNYEELSVLGFMLGQPSGVQLTLAPVTLPDLERVGPLEYATLEPLALAGSPELRQHALLVEVAHKIRKEVQFSFLGVSSLSRGVAGGVFDELPIPDGLGFGTAAAIRISKAKKQMLELQKKGIEESLKRTLRVLVHNYNFDLANYPGLKRRAQLARASLDQLYERLALGENVDALDLVEASRNNIQADTALFAAQFRFLTHADRLERLLLRGDYSGSPPDPIP